MSSLLGSWILCDNRTRNVSFWNHTCRPIRYLWYWCLVSRTSIWPWGYGDTGYQCCQCTSCLCCGIFKLDCAAEFNTVSSSDPRFNLRFQHLDQHILGTFEPDTQRDKCAYGPVYGPTYERDRRSNYEPVHGCNSIANIYNAIFYGAAHLSTSKRHIYWYVYFSQHGWALI